MAEKIRIVSTEAIWLTLKEFQNNGWIEKTAGLSGGGYGPWSFQITLRPLTNDPKIIEDMQRRLGEFGLPIEIKKTV